MRGRSVLAWADRNQTTAAVAAGLLAGLLTTAKLVFDYPETDATLVDVAASFAVLFVFVGLATATLVGLCVWFWARYRLVWPALAVVAFAVDVARPPQGGLGNPFVGMVVLAVVLAGVAVVLGGIEAGLRRAFGEFSPSASDD